MSEVFRTNFDIMTRSRVLSTISRLSYRCQYLPHSYWIDPTTITLPDEPHTSGAYGKIHLGKQKGEPVAVKVLRTSHQENSTKLKRVSMSGGRGAKHMDTV